LGESGNWLSITPKREGEGGKKGGEKVSLYWGPKKITVERLGVFREKTP